MKMEPKTDDAAARTDSIRTLQCTCASCGRHGTHIMNRKEASTYRTYMKIGRAAGRLDQLFPDIPAWIRYGCLESTSAGKTYCPACKP